MQQPVQITFRDVLKSPAIIEHIQKKAEKLNQFSRMIISCHVIVELAQKHQLQGKRYNVRIILALPEKKTIAINHHQDENLYIAIRDAFLSAERVVEESMRVIRGDVKHHAGKNHGKITRLFPGDGFGFIEDATGMEYYFNADNVVHDRFNKLREGSWVQFIEHVGDDGHSAHRVSRLGGAH